MRPEGQGLGREAPTTRSAKVVNPKVSSDLARRRGQVGRDWAGKPRRRDERSLASLAAEAEPGRTIDAAAFRHRLHSSVGRTTRGGDGAAAHLPSEHMRCGAGTTGELVVEVGLVLAHGIEHAHHHNNLSLYLCGAR